MELFGLLVGEDEAVGGEADGGGHDFCESEAAVVALGIDESGDGAGDADGAVADDAGFGDDIAAGIEIHVGGGGEGSLLAVIDEDVALAVVAVDEGRSAGG